jgi:hypothetical protein
MCHTSRTNIHTYILHIHHTHSNTLIHIYIYTYAHIQEISPGGLIHIYTADLASPIGLILQTPHHISIAQPACVFHPEGEPLCANMELVDDQGEPVELALEYETSSWGDITVSVCPNYVVLNRSGIALGYGRPDVYGHSTEVIAPAAAQSYAIASSIDIKSTSTMKDISVLSFNGSDVTSTCLYMAIRDADWSNCIPWSNPIPVGIVGSSSCVQLAGAGGGSYYGPRPVYELTIRTDGGAMRYARVVTVDARFSVTNTLGTPVQVRGQIAWLCMCA